MYAMRSNFWAEWETVWSSCTRTASTCAAAARLCLQPRLPSVVLRRRPRTPSVAPSRIRSSRHTIRPEIPRRSRFASMPWRATTSPLSASSRRRAPRAWSSSRCLTCSPTATTRCAPWAAPSTRTTMSLAFPRPKNTAAFSSRRTSPSSTPLCVRTSPAAAR